MTKPFFRRTALKAAMLLCAAMPLAHAQTYPDKALRLIVPLSSGSITDNVARMVAQKLSDHIKQPVVVENRTGAGGIVALKALQSAAPDGYTFGLLQSGATIQPYTVKDFPFDIRKDFQALTMMYAGPLMLVVPANLPANSVTEYFNYIKQNPSKAFYGSSGAGTTTHLAMELLMQTTGTNLTHVPFKGSAEVYTNMIGGAVNGYFDLYGTAKPMIDSGRVKVIGVASTKPMAVLPNVPPISEVAPGFEVSGWTAFALPLGTPKAVSDKLGNALRTVMADPEFQSRMRAMGTEPGGNSAAEVAQFIAREYEKWGRVTQAANIKAQ